MSDHAPADAEPPLADTSLPCLAWFVLLPRLADRKDGTAARLPPDDPLPPPMRPLFDACWCCCDILVRRFLACCFLLLLPPPPAVPSSSSSLVSMDTVALSLVRTRLDSFLRTAVNDMLLPVVLLSLAACFGAFAAAAPPSRPSCKPIVPFK